MWSDKEGTKFQEMILKPVAMFENPFFHSPHKLVLCDFWLTMDKPAGNSSINLLIILTVIISEKFEDTKAATRSRKTRKTRQKGT